MKDKKIALIGAGKIGGCLLNGLLADNYPAASIYVSTPHIDKLLPLKNKWPINITSNNREAVQQADIVLLAVKPTVVPSVINELKDVLQEKNCLLISVAAGVKIEYFAQQLGKEYPVVRCMPNIAISVRAGMTGLYAASTVSDEGRNWAESIFRSLGVTLWLEKEALLDTITAVSGSGPAYFFKTMEALQSAAEALGLSNSQAHLLVVQTALGAVRLAMETEQPLDTLWQQVVSKGGTTEAAMKVLEKANIDKLFADTVRAAHQRAQTLSGLTKT